MLFIIRLLLVTKNKIFIMIEYYFIPVCYILSKRYNLVKMEFLTLIFRPFSREPTRHAYHKHHGTQRVNNTFVITYAFPGV